jgi:tRNA modification GTPase
LSVKHSETIVAIATPPGKGGVGIVRVSGPLSQSIATTILHYQPKLRYAHYSPFYNKQGEVLDEGIALFFKGPHSFSGEDVLELQAHGGPVVLDRLLSCIIALGARQAEPGEFSKQAFLNNKIDLSQAEAIADLINAESEQAARSALRTMQGALSNHIHGLLDRLIQMRVFVEAALDFPEEEIDFIAESSLLQDLEGLSHDMDTLIAQAGQGVVLQEGMHVVIAGPPNAGKSSLLNALSGRDSAIVTALAGTTRDLLKEHIHIDGMPLHVMDTAGIRESDHVVEQEGIRRAKQAMAQADLILYVYDGCDKNKPLTFEQSMPAEMTTIPSMTIVNKIDLLGDKEQCVQENGKTTLYLSAKETLGIDLLKDALKKHMGYNRASENDFSARRRHIDCLQCTNDHLKKGLLVMKKHGSAELLAEDLRCAQEKLAEITGEFGSDDLLGKIFSSFCIGK